MSAAPSPSHQMWCHFWRTCSAVLASVHWFDGRTMHLWLSAGRRRGDCVVSGVQGFGDSTSGAGLLAAGAAARCRTDGRGRQRALQHADQHPLNPLHLRAELCHQMQCPKGQYFSLVGKNIRVIGKVAVSYLSGLLYRIALKIVCNCCAVCQAAASYLHCLWRPLLYVRASAVCLKICSHPRLLQHCCKGLLAPILSTAVYRRPKSAECWVSRGR